MIFTKKNSNLNPHSSNAIIKEKLKFFWSGMLCFEATAPQKNLKMFFNLDIKGLSKSCDDQIIRCFAESNMWLVLQSIRIT